MIKIFGLLALYAATCFGFARRSLGFVQGPWPGPDPPAGKGPQGPEKGEQRVFVRTDPSLVEMGLIPMVVRIRSRSQQSGCQSACVGEGPQGPK